MKPNLKEINNELTIVDVWNILKKYFLFIIVTTVVFFLSAAIYVWFIVTPEFISNADVMVQVEQDSGSSSDPNYDLVNAFRLIDTVAELMEKDIILENAVGRLISLGYSEISSQYLRDGLSVKSSSTSYFINISFVDEDTSLSSDSVDAIIDAIIEETDVIDAFPVLTNKIRRTSFASEAIYYSPNKILVSIVGVVLGVVFSTGIIFIKESLTTKFSSKEEIETVLDLQVLGVIPKMESREAKNVKIKK